MSNSTPAPQPLRCGCTPHDPWPPPRISTARPPAPPPGAATGRYGLRGPQIEPEAAFWTLCEVPCVVRIRDLVKLTDELGDCYFPEYPTDEDTLREELDELLELASLRDEPDALVSYQPGRERKGISPLLQLRPQPIGAVVNIDRDPVLGAIRAGHAPRPDAVAIARGDEVHAGVPVVRTGRELARYFESETPGLAHRLALNELIRTSNWSPPRQALVWAALDITIYSALLAAWHYKWAAQVAVPGVSARPGVSFRPRPYEMDHRISVLYNRSMNDAGSGDDGRRTLPDPSPGTPRHPAYPSGHSTYSAAASELLSYFFPDYTEEFDRLADNAGMARLWAGIHWRSDHVEGMRLGRCVAQLVIRQLERTCVCPVDPCLTPDNCAPPPTDDDLAACAEATLDCCGRHPDGNGNGNDNGDDHDHHRDDERETRAADVGAAAAPASSDAAVEAGAAGPQEGGSPPAQNQAEQRQAAGPQEGAPSGGAEQRAQEQAEGPQEGG